MLNPREALREYQAGARSMSNMMPDEMTSFNNFVDLAFKDNKLDLKTKELIAVAISVYSRCEYCIVGHAYNALAAGLSKEEIMEAAMVTMAFGGGPTAAYSATLLETSLSEFEKDFK